MSSRREFIQNCKIGVIALTTNSLTSCLLLKDTRKSSERAGRTIQFNQDWLFGGEFKPEMLAPDFNDVAFSKVTLPHSVVKLPWRDWNPGDWQKEWIYRKHFRRPVELKGMRVFLHFDGVMVGAEPTINGHNLPQHMGGYLPFNYEITDWLSDENLLSVKVDSRWSNVPPQGAEMGAKRIDYMEPGGIHRSVRLEAVPQNFISDVFAKPVRVLKSDRAVDITCTLDLAVLPKEATSVQVKMKKGDSVVASSIKKIDDIKPGKTEVALSLTDLKDVTLWDVDNPFLYDIEATLLVGNQPLHDFRTRTGLREARFELDGFYLNGRRLQIFGLNRHEIYPYVGFALPDRVMRRDAWILKKEFNCNTVRCSHYPQTEAFLDACDELGLLVWEEIPGWGYLGDDAWKKLVLRDVKDMILRDRNHPSIFIWGISSAYSFKITKLPPSEIANLTLE